jgi:hypothetical protein
MNILKQVAALVFFYLLAHVFMKLFHLSFERSCIYGLAAYGSAHIFNKEAHIPWSER